MARVVWCSAHSCSDLQQATWFLVATGVLEALTEQHWQPKNLLDTRSAVSAKLKLSQLSTLQRRHSSLIWPFAKWDAVMKERIFFFPQCNTSKINLCPHNWRFRRFQRSQIHQWSSAARVSVSKCTNPWYMTHRVLSSTIREPRQVCLSCAGLWLWVVVWGFRTVQIPLAGRHWYYKA